MTQVTYAMTESEQQRVALLKRVALMGDRGITELINMLGDSSWVVRRF